MNVIYVIDDLSDEASVTAMSEELLQLDAVETVAVDRSTGRVTLTVIWPLVDQDVRDAVERAGLNMINPSRDAPTSWTPSGNHPPGTPRG